MRIPKRKLLLVPILAFLVIWLALHFALLPIMERRMNRVSGHSIPVSSAAKQLHGQLRLADLHADSLLFDRDLTRRWDRGHVDLVRLKEGHYALQNFTVVTKVPWGINIERNPADSDEVGWAMAASLRPVRAWRSPLQRALYQADNLHRYERSGEMQIVLKRSDVQEAIASGKIAATLGLEGAHALEAKLDNLQVLFDAGFRTVGLVHFFDNEFAGSAHGENKGGLTPLGRQLVAEVERKHMIVDLAHSSPQTIRDVLAIATRPMIVSHTGVKGTCDNRRNLSDDEVKAIATRGGLIGIGFWDTAVCGNDAHAVAKAIAYTVNLAGVEHVALGSDFDGAVTVPFDAAHADQLTQALLDEGMSEQQLRAVMGENAIRFFSENLPE